MPVLSSNLKHSINLSLTDLSTKLSNKQDEFDRAPTVSEEKYDSKVLIGNWFNRRASYIPSNKWITNTQTIYKQHYKSYDIDIYKKNQVPFWNNKIKNEGLFKGTLMNHHGKSYYNNMTTTYDLSYRILPTQSQKSHLRIYNIRKNRWLPEQDLTENFGNLTKIGIKDVLQIWWDSTSNEATQFCRWRTTYQDEYKAHDISLVKKKFHRQQVNMNVPYLNNLGHIDDYSNSCPITFKNSSSKIVN
ncbi:uncharacterized protein C1orf158 homolog isoform X1 [Vespula pensylvanica]|uniref:uncharacterized protein C1orf158 homolog isoform X1 n=1 Tax=Vespula pensylvanica TaxID=30213 RepID=UPI001CBA0A87|nr:uncharacterized protein C1orf158 homolog isoform X1 [Vespula pensylvanica]XP_043663652.1 uncharacterized protein C1orf158 homolog isoform X1 [Vespula pensylvanica]